MNKKYRKLLLLFVIFFSLQINAYEVCNEWDVFPVTKESLGDEVGFDFVFKEILTSQVNEYLNFFDSLKLISHDDSYGALVKLRSIEDITVVDFGICLLDDLHENDKAYKYIIMAADGGYERGFAIVRGGNIIRVAVYDAERKPFY